MGHDKLRKFAENETFKCLLQPSSEDILADGYKSLRNHPIKGRWCGSMFWAEAPIVVELGCGKGEYTIDLAKRCPERNYVGVDIKGARLWRGAKTATELQLPNVAFLRTRIEFLTALFGEGEVSQIWLTFSDPQMKSENSRLSSPMFLERYRQILKPGGVVHLKTDSRFLHEYTKSVISINKLKMLACTDDLYSTTPDTLFPSDSRMSLEDRKALYEVRTFYEKMFLEQGYKITYLSFVIDHEGDFVYPDDFDEAYWRAEEGPRRSFSHQPNSVQ